MEREGKAERTHQRLTCEAKLPGGRTCAGKIGFFWYPMLKIGILGRGESARPGCDSIVCADCGTKWEVMRDPREAAA